VLYSFTGGDDGSYPTGNLLYSNGTLYGAARLNGVKAQGTIFAVSLNGKFTLLHGFTAGNNDGGSPNGGLAIRKGTLYGTTASGGRSDKGTVFSINRAGKEQLLYAFKGGSDGEVPLAGLVDIKGTLYGTTVRGGRSGRGTVFKLRP
jgi:uncharacterized repeat protein (TIGR03803 family)